LLGGKAFQSEQRLASAADISSMIGQSRDLRYYDDGGLYTQSKGDQHIIAVQKLREFIWTHWSQKRPGYVQFMYRGTNTFLFIEAHGDRWHIAWRDVQVLPGAPPSPAVDARDIVAVEQRDGSLVFLDADGKIVRYL
jgi:hypothetical protein